MNFRQLLSNPLQKRGTFDKISGNENIKWAFEAALRSDKPVHILLVGPPGIGKTRFLKAIENRFPDKSYFALSSGATGAGMVNQLFEQQPRYLLVDEIEDLRKTDQAVLMSLMQDQELVETKVTKTRRMSLSCTIFATCNDTKKLREPLLTRFTIIRMDQYTPEQFMKICVQQLDCDEDLAIFVAEKVLERKKPNIRDCERIVSMCHSKEEVLKYLELIK